MDSTKYVHVLDSPVAAEECRVGQVFGNHFLIITAKSGTLMLQD